MEAIGYIGVFSMLIGHLTDFLYQADQHGWMNGFRLHRGEKWPWYADWIPHDPWHIVQTTRNMAQLAGATLITLSVAHQAWYIVPLAVGASYACTRFLGFTLPMWLWK